MLILHLNLLIFLTFILALLKRSLKLLSQSLVTGCNLDPIPASLVEQCASVVIPAIIKIINL
jgi:hypothetical protein